MEESIQATAGLVLSLLGFIGTIGIIIGGPVGIILLIIGLNQKEAQKKKKYLIWAAIIALGPIGLILLTLISFAVVNAF
ncbi:MAG: hypothetical protein WC924_05200 [Candidatus Gracilibacteria bacterium]